MNLSKQIKKNRERLKLSQGELASKVFVSRQSISNWEMDKNYPDLQSLLAMSELFEVTLDDLVRGDLVIMKEALTISDNDRYYVAKTMAIIFLFGYLSVLMLSLFFHSVILLVFSIILFTCGFSFWIYQKGLLKKYRLREYEEIIAFIEGSQFGFDDQKLSSRLASDKVTQKIVICLVLGVLVMIAW